MFMKNRVAAIHAIGPGHDPNMANARTMARTALLSFWIQAQGFILPPSALERFTDTTGLVCRE